jgi:hypothetical protein
MTIYQSSGSVGIPHPDPLVRGTDPRIRIRTKMSRSPTLFSTKIPTKVFLEGWESGLFDFDNLVNFLAPCSWIRIRICILKTDLDPGEPNECGSGSTTLFMSSLIDKKLSTAVYCVGYVHLTDSVHFHHVYAKDVVQFNLQLPVHNCPSLWVTASPNSGSEPRQC